MTLLRQSLWKKEFSFRLPFHSLSEAGSSAGCTSYDNSRSVVIFIKKNSFPCLSVSCFQVLDLRGLFRALSFRGVRFFGFHHFARVCSIVRAICRLARCNCISPHYLLSSHAVVHSCSFLCIRLHLQYSRKSFSPLIVCGHLCLRFLFYFFYSRFRTIELQNKETLCC